MALTPQEEAELAQLQTEVSTYDDAHSGEQAVAKVDEHRKSRPATRPFSFFRATVGAFRDAGQDLEDLVFDVAPYMPGSINPEATKAALKPIHEALTLPKLKGEEDAGTVERVVRGIGEFAIPFSVWGKAVGIARGASWLGRAGRAMLAGAATDFGMNPQTTNMANAMRDVFGIDNDTLDALASEEDDNRLVARFKAAAVNAPLSLAGDAVFEAGLRGVRAYRAWRGSFEEADAAVKAARHDIPVEPRARGPEAATEAGPKAAPEFDATKHVATEAPPEKFEDVVDFLKRKTTEGASEEDLTRFAQHLADGDPEHALRNLGIDPLKLDYAALDNPELLGKLHGALTGVYEGIAQRLGRTGIRVTEQETAKAARTLASTADVLKDLYGHTSNLAETMMASRLFVGAHSQKLVSQAEEAIAALKAGKGDTEWLAFLESFQRHAYFMGALRGAGSEVGRALRSLQMIAKVGKSGVKREFAAAKEAADAAHVGPSGAREVAAQAADAVSAMTDPAERILFLGKIVHKSGDIGDLSRFSRASAGSLLVKRLDGVVRETLGNLFTAGTATRNAISGVSLVGLKGVSMALASISRMALSPLGKARSQEARVQLMRTWAYVDGALTPWREALSNTMALMEREGMEELAVNASGLGLKGVATKAAGLAESGRAKLTGEFERVDISSRARAFSMSPSDLRYLNEHIEAWNTPKLMEHSMKWLVRALAVPVNAAGTLSRLGTILFINGPDQLIGTMAARAGAQAKAMEIAAVEAAELQLEGKGLSDYMKARMVQLTETATGGWADDAYSAGRQEAVLSAGEHEAKSALFQDDLELGVSNSVMNLSHKPFFSLLVPFVKTPLRILEVTAIDYSPLGLLKDRIRADIVAGGARRDEALARMGLGLSMVYAAFALSEDRTVVGHDGDYRSSARLSRPNYSLKIGDDSFQFNSIDPIGTLLGWGADVHAYLRDQEDNPEASGKALQMFEAAAVATQQNVLSKTWLASLKNLSELVDASSGDEFSTRLHNYLNQFATRFTPGAGIQRGVERSVDPAVHQASNFIESAIGTSVGADKLPVKRDYLLGRPVPVEAGERLIGVKSGPGASEIDEPLLAELERLSFDIPAAKRTVLGVKLNSAQFSRWLELKGQVVTKDSTGFTLEQSLSHLIQLPEYQALPRAGRVQAIRDEMDGYSQLATQELLREDPGFAKAAVKDQTYNAMILQGASRGEMDAQTEQFARELGIAE